MSDLPSIPGPAPAPAGPPPAPPAADDASSQALSAALRSGFLIVRALMAILAVCFLFSGVFYVHPNEVVVLLRFGKPVGSGAGRLLTEGLHFAWPYPIDEKVRIPGQSHTVRSSTGWHLVTPDMEAQNIEPMARGSLSPEADGYTLTSDANIIHVRATIKYHVTEPLRYAFAFTNAPAILTNVVNNAIFRASARTTANAALHEDKTGFRDLVLSLVRQKIEELNLGIELEPSDVETKAPADVRLAFDAVVNASLDRGKTISDARGYYDRLTRTAGGEADKTIGEGLVQSNRWVQAVTADARAFGEQLPHYRSDPGLFQQRMLLATMQRVLTNAQEKFFLPERPAGLPREVRLLLSREPEKIEAKEPR